jgi:2-polyprenyl-3-methyl-5-hydroxy-6-metoxy-1,4-benzoquinol methylase
MDIIVRHYENEYTENTRLDRDNAHRTEFLTTVHLLDRYISPGSRVLDVGAATGKYSFYFASVICKRKKKIF